MPKTDNSFDRERQERLRTLFDEAERAGRVFEFKPCYTQLPAEPLPAGATISKEPHPTPSEMAYGLLWRIDKAPTPISHFVRKLLLIEICQDGQRRGIAWAKELFGEVTEAEIWADAWRGP